MDVEFTANFVDGGAYRINPVQCRPLQVKGTDRTEPPRIDVDPATRILEAQGPVIGHSRFADIDRIIYVVPSAYGGLRLQDRYGVARLIGQINGAMTEDSAKTVMLVGPGLPDMPRPEPA